LPDPVVLRDPPGFAMCRNWPGMGVFLRHYCARTAPGLAAVLLLVLAAWYGMREPFRTRFGSIFGLAATPQAAGTAAPTVGSQRAWNMVGWIALTVAFFALEWRESYYFTQDDALAGELPGILLGCRSLWEGTFPDWNPYVFLGAPLATIGFWAITYPPQLASYAIARHVLGDEFATLEVCAALHLVVGFLAMRHLSRRIGMGPMPANLAALWFVFAGCILIMGRSWHAFIANAVWLPLVGIAVQRFRESPVGWKWIVGVGLTLGLSFHAGFPQIFAILVMFLVFGVTTVALAERMPLGRVAPVAPALLLGVGVAAPRCCTSCNLQAPSSVSSPSRAVSMTTCMPRCYRIRSPRRTFRRHGEAPTSKRSASSISSAACLRRCSPCRPCVSGSFAPIARPGRVRGGLRAASSPC
jgi:hypothetical protein